MGPEGTAPGSGGPVEMGACAYIVCVRHHGLAKSGWEFLSGNSPEGKAFSEYFLVGIGFDILEL